MDINNFVMQHKLKFLSNNSDFNEQPIFLLSENSALTGCNFISVYRIRKTREEAASGIMGLSLGTSAGLWNVSGSKDVYCKSITSNGRTADSIDYKITTVMNNNNQLTVIVNDNIFMYGDIVLTGFNQLPSMNYLSLGMRIDSGVIPPLGSQSASLINYYTFNREELGSSLTSVNDRSGNSVSASLKGKAAGDSTSATVTGWSYGPIEGGFRLDGGGYIESDTSSYWQINNLSSSSLSFMMSVKLVATGNTNIVSLGSGTSEILSLKENSGVLTFKTGDSSITCCNLEFARWNHLAITMNGSTASSTGCYVYVNGKSASYTGINIFPTLSNIRMIIGKDMDLVSSSMTGVVGITKTWNRALSAQEVMMHYLSSIPPQIDLDSIIIG